MPGCTVRPSTVPPPLQPGPAPRSLAALRGLLPERRASLPMRLAQVANFALGDPDEMAFGTVATVADLAGVQPSTLVRLAQALGHDGFSDLQTVFHALVRNRWPDYEDRLEALSPGCDAGPEALLAVFCESRIRSPEHLKERASGEALARAVVAITGSPFSPLMGSARAWLEVAEADFGDFRSVSVTFALAMTLAVSVGQRRAGRAS